MSEIENPPAFPVVPQSVRNPENPNETVFHHGHYGMTILDYFAAAALQGMLANPKVYQYHNNGSDEIINAVDDKEFLALDAYEYANTMLAQRNKS